MSSSELIKVGQSQDGGVKASETYNDAESHSESRSSGSRESTERGEQPDYQIEEKKMHGNSLIDIVKKRSISGGLSPIEEDQQQQRLNDPRSPIDDE